jgi:ABC-type phosphate transport system substrate-binding protein
VRADRLLASAGALAAAALISALLAVCPPEAHAAFTVAHCAGSATAGQGSSAQKEAQQEFWIPTVFHGASGCGAGAPAVEYQPLGSGCGIASIGGEITKAACDGFGTGEGESGPGIRAEATRYGGSDAPLTATQQSNADAAGGPHPGLIHQIPVASFAVAIIVHFPDGCKLKSPGAGKAAGGAGSENQDSSTGGPNDPVGGETGDSASEETLRVHISAEEMEKIWDGESQTWGDIVPEADLEEDGKAAKPMSAEECAELPVIRIVRFDGSGTTFNFKSYLGLLPGAPAGLWTSAPVKGDNTVWPITNGGSKETPHTVNGSKECTEVSHICTAVTNGGGALTEAVAATNGSIGYADLATSRKHNFYMEKKKDDHTYWAPMQTISPEEGDKVGTTTWVEPSEVPTSNTSPSPEGANCTGADYRSYPAATAEQPDPTLGDWENAIATGSTAATIEKEPVHAYPICGLTYDFAFDDDAPVYGNSLAEQEKARTVKDYLEAVESTQGQFQLALHDYGTLPLNVIEIARKGVEAIGWEKSAGSGKGTEEIQKKPEEKAKAPEEAAKPAPPSNSFSITSAKIKSKKLVISLELPGAGAIEVKAVGGGKTLGSESGHVSGGQGTVTLSISRTAISKIEKAKGHKLKVTITVTFTPTGGSAASHTKQLTITAAEVKGKAGKGHKKGKKRK